MSVSKFSTFLSPPSIFEDIEIHISNALKTGFLAPVGPQLDQFENNIENLIEDRENYSLALNSGTSALHLALILLEVKRGDVVLCQSLTFVSCLNTILYVGAKPVFIDSEKDSWNMDPDLLVDAIENLKIEGIEPRAVLVINLFGNPYKVNEISQIASEHNIPVLEDAAGALGSKYNNEECGSFGDMSIFSFNGNKIISTGGGGILNTRSKEDYDLGLYLATQSKEKCDNYLHKNIGFNYRMSNISAAIGNAMIPYLDDLVMDRRRVFEVYKNELSHLIEFQKELSLAFSNRWLTVGLCKTNSDRDLLLKSLSDKGIESRPVWIPMHKQPIGLEFKCFSNGVSESLSQRGICLPSGFGLDPMPIIKIIKDSCE